jgi:tetratricopeptide (TPR) repeat protein
MAYSSNRDLIQTAKEAFIEGDYATAEPMLQQALLKDNKDPEVYQMLATLYYDKGQFNKAIKTFKKALEIDPGYTDASVGLSIILNDLGRYDEAKSIFNDAQKKLDDSKKKDDPFINDRIAQKHIELGDLYFQIERFDESLEQYFKAKKMLTNVSKMILKIADCLVKISKPTRAIRELQLFLRDYPQNNDARKKG